MSDAKVVRTLGTFKGLKGFCRGCMGIMEKNMETTIVGLMLGTYIYIWIVQKVWRRFGSYYFGFRV